MPTPDRVAFTVFGLEIMWYGIIIAIGISLVVFLVCKRAPKHHISEDKALNFAIVLVIAGIIGARLYYVIFNWDYYADDFREVFNLRGGGLAIHGGLILGALAAIILCRFWKERPLNLLDLCFTAVPLGQAIGRWGNYFNSEAHGGPTTLPWGIMVDGVKVHPTFLYESIWCLLLFFFLLWSDNRRKFAGQTTLLYCMIYSFERFFVESLRTDSLMLFGLFKQAKALSVVVFIAALIAYIILGRKAKNKENKASVLMTLTDDGETAEISFDASGVIEAQEKNAKVDSPDASGAIESQENEEVSSDASEIEEENQ